MDVYFSATALNHVGTLSLAKQSLRLGGALSLSLCVLVAIRGLLGALRAPDQIAFLLLVAVTAELLASLFRIVWRWLALSEAASRTRFSRMILPSVCVLCIGLALSMSGASIGSIGFAWLIIAGGEVAWWFPELRSTQQPVPLNSNMPTAEARESPDVDFADEEELDPSITQQITRSRNDEGGEVISGILRAEFASGEQYQNLHVAFCPPLEHRPQIIAHQLDGSPLTIKVAQSEIFGARIELRLDAATRTGEQATICFESQPRNLNA
jgi:hypothetical protein